MEALITLSECSQIYMDQAQQAGTLEWIYAALEISGRAK
jgi:hypothetical protein